MPYPNPLIIGLTGYKQSGKDTVASCIISQVPRVVFPIVMRRGFADSLKEEVAEILNSSVEHIEKNKQHPLIRHILQWYGTDYVRNNDNDAWIKHMDNTVKDLCEANTKQMCIVIPDVRFVNEAEWIHANNGVVLFVERAGQTSDDKHRSETELLKIKYDFRVDNNGTSLSRLTWEVRCVLSFIYERYGHFKPTK
jgi:Golgi nucleoside diphosphatase